MSSSNRGHNNKNKEKVKKEIPTPPTERTSVQQQYAAHKKSLKEIPPHNIDAERFILGACLFKNDAVIEALRYFSPDDFYKASHHIIFEAMYELFEHDKEFDLIILKDWLERKKQLDIIGGTTYLATIQDSYGFTAANVKSHAEIVHECAKRRKLQNFGFDLAAKCYDANIGLEELSTYVETAVFSFHQDITQQTACNIDLNYIPLHEQVLVKIDDSPLLSPGNMMGVVSGIGIGKSHFCEFMASKWVNPCCEQNGKIEVCPDEGICLYIDTERPLNDCFYGFRRIYRRTAAEHDPDILNEDGKSFKKLLYKSFISIDTAEKKFTELLHLIRKTPHLRFLILDGILDFCRDFNSVEESDKVCSILYALANQYHFGILYTTHSNRNDQSGKGKGHVGAIFQQRSTSFLRLKPDAADDDIKVLSSYFENRKIRSGYDKVATAFKWDENDHMFHEIPYELLVKDKKTLDLETNFEFVFQDKEQLSHKELIEIYMERTGKARSTAELHIKKAVEQKILIKEKTYAIYRLNRDIINDGEIF